MPVWESSYLHWVPMSDPNVTDASTPTSTDSGSQLTPTLSTTSPFPYCYQANDGHYDNNYQQRQYYNNTAPVQQPMLSNPYANNDSVVYDYNIDDDFPEFDTGYDENYFDQPGPSGISFEEPKRKTSDLLSSPEEYDIYLRGNEQAELTDLEQYDYEDLQSTPNSSNQSYNSPASVQLSESGKIPTKKRGKRPQIDADGNLIEPKTKDRAKEKMAALEMELEELRKANDAKNEQRKGMVEEIKRMKDYLQKHQCALKPTEQAESRSYTMTLFAYYVKAAKFMNAQKMPKQSTRASQEQSQTSEEKHDELENEPITPTKKSKLSSISVENDSDEDEIQIVDVPFAT
ncbi:hypothetical protein WR25_25339 [Diploscapter pachys]|uniref:Uncharacterized protein n=1 Tax=Diploscapter pachys TaxID=2018661 RepID=A0A2A2JHI5_9BILA|nr:hypothetical protein WR25_25339 [Diploscapter pachys]